MFKHRRYILDGCDVVEFLKIVASHRDFCSSFGLYLRSRAVGDATSRLG
jgi:hypothetical protein